MAQRIFLVDDDADLRDSLRVLLEAAGYSVRDFGSAREFLADLEPKEGCLVADIRMPAMSGLELQEELVRRGVQLGVVFITGHADVPVAVHAMKLGAVDFIEKPFAEDALLQSIERGLKAGRRMLVKATEAQAAKKLLETLTTREQDVLSEIVKGHPNKIVAFELEISIRTVEIHRANVMRKLNARNLSDLVRTTLAAGAGTEAGSD